MKLRHKCVRILRSGTLQMSKPLYRHIANMGKSLPVTYDVNNVKLSEIL